jgi:hypothetical protein
MKYTLRVLSAVAGLCFLGTICFLLWPTELKQRLGDDVFKLTYQFLLLVVIGGALSFLYQEFQHQREQREAERVLQRQFLVDLLEVNQAANEGPATDPSEGHGIHTRDQGYARARQAIRGANVGPYRRPPRFPVT